MAWGYELGFIVVDGLDGCGKDTHAQRIKQLIESEGRRVLIVSHPSTRLFGRLSKRNLQGSGPVARLLATVFFVADVLESVRLLRIRRKDETVILVRYLLGTAYLPEGLAPLGYALFRKVLPFPDIAFFIDIEPEVALRRIALRGHAPEMFETPEKLGQTRRIAKSLIGNEWVVIDNSEDGERPFKDVERIIRERLSPRLA